ncbi:MAG: hypothetical protein K6E50_07090 [Lachnospiraceae bacterium]|nr:hypothetical protein [Lachnospiraceae bacterium]
MMYDIPVTLIMFNRPDTLMEVFEEIRRVQPAKLYVICDGPREGREDDRLKVAQCRSYVESHIDWDCELHRVYAEKNMGCRDRVYTGISEVLKHESSTVILEDDVVPAPAFFPYMRQMLRAYADDKKVMMVSGTNLVRDYRMPGPYCFSCFSSIWGWGTWARAWKLYDVDVKDWPQRKKDRSLVGVYGLLSYPFLKLDVERVYTKQKDTWDIQWDYCRHVHRGLGIVPRENLVRNIGFEREDATHTKGETHEDFSYGDMKLPLPENLPIVRDRDYDRAYLKKYFGVGKVLNFVEKKLKGQS